MVKDRNRINISNYIRVARDSLDLISRGLKDYPSFDKEISLTEKERLALYKGLVLLKESTRKIYRITEEMSKDIGDH